MTNHFADVCFDKMDVAALTRELNFYRGDEAYHRDQLEKAIEGHARAAEALAALERKTA